MRPCPLPHPHPLQKILSWMPVRPYQLRHPLQKVTDGIFLSKNTCRSRRENIGGELLPFPFGKKLSRLLRLFPLWHCLFSSFVALGVRSNDSWHSESIPYLILEHEGGSRQADKHYDNAQGQ